MENSFKKLSCSLIKLLDELKPKPKPHSRLILPVKDRSGHDRRYAIDPQRIKNN